MTAIVIVAITIAGFVVVSLFGSASRIAKQIKPNLVGRKVRIEAWGQELAATDVKSILTVGLGLHVMASGHHIKVAMPRDMQANGERIAIGWANYVQFDGKKIPRSDAPAIVFRNL